MMCPIQLETTSLRPKSRDYRHQSVQPDIDKHVTKIDHGKGVHNNITAPSQKP